MAYPHGIDAMPTFTNGVSPTDPTPSAVLDAAEMTLIAGAITRIQQTLGIDPASGSLSVADRLASIEQVLQGKASASDAVTEAELATALETMVDAATLTAALAPLAPIESPDLTGAPTAPTAAPGTATTQLATTDFVAQALGEIDHRAGTLAEWAEAEASGPVLLAGERAYITDLKLDVVGDGVTKVAGLGAVGSGTYAQKSATWATGVDYVVDELVINSGTSASTTAHTSGASFDAGNFTAIAT